MHLVLTDMKTTTTTSLMAIAAAVAMVGGATTITSLMTIQKAEAAFCPSTIPEPNPKACFCYDQIGVPQCYPNKGDCRKAQASDLTATSGCYKGT